MKTKTILFRSDASHTIGVGHIMRDIVLAKEFEKQGDKILFACMDLEGNISSKIPYQVISLETNNIEELSKIIIDYKVDMIVIDHYKIDCTFEKKLKEKVNIDIFVLDDLYQKHYCDILLNHNVSADSQIYKELVPSWCEIRCGKEYTLIRDEFKKEKEIKREKIYDYFVSMGGTDVSNISIDILKELPDSQKVAIVTTNANKNLDSLKNYVQDKENIALFIDSNQIATILNKSKKGIITTSSVVHELLFLEIPFIGIQVVKNQDRMFRYLKENDYIVMKEYRSEEFKKSLEKLEVSYA